MVVQDRIIKLLEIYMAAAGNSLCYRASPYKLCVVLSFINEQQFTV